MSRSILPEPPGELKQHSHRLTERILEAIRGEGCIPFSRYMEMALYEPGLGYYSAGLHKLGRSGDFTTAPELGPLFAACLARQASEIGARLGEYDVLEIGAGTGQLAIDFLSHLPDETEPCSYRILERSADLRDVQKKRIEQEIPHWADRVFWLDEPPSEAWQGLLIANEVIDALAVERFEVNGPSVDRLCVAESRGILDWARAPAQDGLETAVRHIETYIGRTLSDGYRSEVQLQLPAWLQAVSGHMARGLALFIDYGHPRDEYYRPERTDGTLMCHFRHQAHDDPFFWPGLQDLTAWVDFTALAEAADACELDVEGYSSQAMFLLGCGLEQVLQDQVSESDDGGVALGAQARQLTLPGMMGEKFQVMGLGRGLDFEPRGFSLLDLRYRL